MNYGDRQERADKLVTLFRAQGSNIAHAWGDRTYTGETIAHEIETMTDWGQNLVAVAGLLLQALASEPEFFERKRS